MDYTKNTPPSWSLALLISSVLLAACDPAPSTPTSEPTPEPISGPLGVLNLNFEQTKQFVFDWSPVPNATHYVLEENPDGESDYQVVANNIAADLTQYRHTVPLYQRTRAHYRLLACLPDQSECPLVGETQVSVNNVAQLVNSVGYFKGFALKSGTLADNEAQLTIVGNAIALSEDGTTLAVGAKYMDTIKLDDAGEPAYITDAGAVFVYRRNDNGQWLEDQQLQAVLPHVRDHFGSSLSLSADGKTLAVGMEDEENDQTGLTMNPMAAKLGYSVTRDHSFASGAAYLFTRNDTDTASPWHATAYIKDEALQVDENFGVSVSLSADGTVLAVGADQGGTAIGDAEVAQQRIGNGAVNLYRLEDSADVGANPTWQFVQTVQSNNAQRDAFGRSVSLDANGTLLAVGAPREADSNGAVHLFIRTNADVNPWQFQQRFQASNAREGALFSFGDAISLSADGQTLAVGAQNESGNACVICQGDSQPTQQSGKLYSSGAVYIFTRTDTERTSIWQQQAYLKAPNADVGDHFGTSVGLNRDGSHLVVGALQEDSPATGLQGDTGNDTEIAEDTGAAYYYHRSGNTWLSPVYLKANTYDDWFMNFGGAVAISGDGETLAVGAHAESSTVTGINRKQSDEVDPSDETVFHFGAVYLY
ncbi:hypothetical protein [Saccharospirillum mangrovi]|uniref:hypothetical protein n=1 Tax=Saccharospirillum mangrovi TaxID=2161747 RepID=UPI000D38D81A|nr:hypothetical protein [Saccharospirillum mangrovi]